MRQREQILQLVTELSISTIDLTPALSAVPLADLFVYPGSHYAATGYRRVAEIVLEQVQEPLRSTSSRVVPNATQPQAPVNSRPRSMRESPRSLD